MIKNLYITLILLSFSVAVYAQKPAKEDKGFLYRSEYVGAVMFHSSGWGGTFYKGVHKGYDKRNLYGLEVVTMKHSKEFKTYNPYYEDSKGYIFGKQNSLIIARPFFGKKKVKFEKWREQGVQIGYIWAIGPSVGLSKPVYLEIGHSSTGSYQYDFITVEKYNSEEHHVDNIYGKAPATKGLDEIKVHPGLYAKFGLNFEYSPQGDGIKSLEAGMTIDAYPARIPLMAEIQNKYVYFAFYVSILYGKKHLN
jgi:hypothetical protein